MRHVAGIIILLLFFLEVLPQPSTVIPGGPICDKGMTGVDTMLTNVRLKYKSSINLNRDVLNVYGYLPDEIPSFNDSVINYRMKQIESPIPMDYNNYVRSYIELYSQRRRESVSKMLGSSDYYFPLFEEILDKYNLPHEFKYLSVVESALNPNAQSWCGATGLWQFMYNTGLDYGLVINTKVDQRKDPVRATEAMCQYITNSYNQFGDWLLAIASYNCGPGWISYAVRKGGSNNFWEIQQYLPSETRGYVPAFLAACYVFKYAPEHNLFPAEPEINYPVERVELNQQVSFYQLSQILGVSIPELEKLNPAYKKGIIPVSTTPNFVVLPQDAAIKYAGNIQKIYNVPDVNYASLQLAEKSKKETSTSATNAKSNNLQGGIVVAAEKKKEEIQPKTTNAIVVNDNALTTEGKSKSVSAIVNVEKPKPMVTKPEPASPPIAKVTAPKVEEKPNPVVTKPEPTAPPVAKVTKPVVEEKPKPAVAKPEPTEPAVAKVTAPKVEEKPKPVAPKPEPTTPAAAKVTTPVVEEKPKPVVAKPEPTTPAVAKVTAPVDEEKPKEIVNDVPIKGNFEKLVYKVHPGGEDLTALCTYYNCNKYVIMKWNDLLDDELIEGTEIKLYVTKSH